MRQVKKRNMHVVISAFITIQLFQCIVATFSPGKTSLILIMPPILAAQTQSPPPSPPPPDWWEPSPGTSWQWQLSGTIDTSFDVDMYDIDYETPTTIIELLHSLGIIVICYMSAGSWESYRSDAAQYPASVLGNTLEGWAEEKWVDIRQIDVLGPILETRMDTAVNKGCDGIEPDNVDAYQNDSGFQLTYNDQIVFNKWLAQQAHERNLSIGLKNDLGQVNDLEPFFDWALNKECFQYNECDSLLTFVNAGKAVFGVEYIGDPNSFCPAANGSNFDWLKKNIELDA